MTDPADQSAPPPPDAEGSPLKSRLAEHADAARRSLQPVAGFSRSDYQTLLAMVEQAEQRLEGAGMELGEGRGRLARHRRVLRDVVRAIEDPGAESPQFSDADVYLTALEVGQLNHIVSRLAHPGGRWTDLVRTVLAPTEAGLDERALEDRRFRLQFIAMCRQAGLRPIRPDAAGAPDDPADALIELGGWRVGLTGRVIETPDLLELGVRAAASRLHGARVPGMLFLEVTRLIWPERRILRVDSDQTAIHELQRRADLFLTEHADRIGALVDPTYVFGVLAVATLPTYNVSSRHIAFSTTFRIASLCDEGDPRLAKLTDFARRFQRAGS